MEKHAIPDDHSNKDFEEEIPNLENDDDSEK